MSDPMTVCLCGSTRFQAEMATANRLLTLAGFIVLAPGVFQHQGDTITPEDEERLDALHLRKIDRADYVVVVAPGGYVGESTRREIAYARRQGTGVTYWHDHELYQEKEPRIRSEHVLAVMDEARALVANIDNPPPERLQDSGSIPAEPLGAGVGPTLTEDTDG
ncbi:hypothetical protein [Nocardiopsis synnemataformans]|uniref:hypothetical protein n=1 Tax=Nocardiopsis synnemataformans TaxID=61305 RepID=UPI003EBAB85C